MNYKHILFIEKSSETRDVTPATWFDGENPLLSDINNFGIEATKNIILNLDNVLKGI